MWQEQEKINKKRLDFGIEIAERGTKKLLRPAERFSFAGAIVEEKHLSIRQACQFVILPRLISVM
ncbi:MAG: hypothetical protein EYC69_06985 [Bacteroidetes bacterium]|nr:MAG: hypothetical protein EYC69_06985 [Bacteroidota bacterium]